MLRSSWAGTLLLMLLGAIVLIAQQTRTVGTTPPAASSAEHYLMVDGQKCRILYCWRKDGSAGCKVQALATGEYMTLMDLPPAAMGLHAPEAKGAARKRIYHWGRAATCPSGFPDCPSPECLLPNSCASGTCSSCDATTAENTRLTPVPTPSVGAQHAWPSAHVSTSTPSSSPSGYGATIIAQPTTPAPTAAGQVSTSSPYNTKPGSTTGQANTPGILGTPSPYGGTPGSTAGTAKVPAIASKASPYNAAPGASVGKAAVPASVASASPYNSPPGATSGKALAPTTPAGASPYNSLPGGVVWTPTPAMAPSRPSIGQPTYPEQRVVVVPPEAQPKQPAVFPTSAKPTAPQIPQVPPGASPYMPSAPAKTLSPWAGSASTGAIPRPESPWAAPVAPNAPALPASPSVSRPAPSIVPPDPVASAPEQPGFAPSENKLPPVVVLPSQLAPTPPIIPPAGPMIATSPETPLEAGAIGAPSAAPIVPEVGTSTPTLPTIPGVPQAPLPQTTRAAPAPIIPPPAPIIVTAPETPKGSGIGSVPPPAPIVPEVGMNTPAVPAIPAVPQAPLPQPSARPQPMAVPTVPEAALTPKSLVPSPATVPGTPLVPRVVKDRTAPEPIIKTAPLVPSKLDQGSTAQVEPRPVVVPSAPAPKPQLFPGRAEPVPFPTSSGTPALTPRTFNGGQLSTPPMAAAPQDTTPAPAAGETKKGHFHLLPWLRPKSSASARTDEIQKVVPPGKMAELLTPPSEPKTKAKTPEKQVALAPTRLPDVPEKNLSAPRPSLLPTVPGTMPDDLKQRKPSEPVSSSSSGAPLTPKSFAAKASGAPLLPETSERAIPHVPGVLPESAKQGMPTRLPEPTPQKTIAPTQEFAPIEPGMPPTPAQLAVRTRPEPPDPAAKPRSLIDHLFSKKENDDGWRKSWGRPAAVQLAQGKPSPLDEKTIAKASAVTIDPPGALPLIGVTPLGKIEIDEKASQAAQVPAATPKSAPTGASETSTSFKRPNLDKLSEPTAPASGNATQVSATVQVPDSANPPSVPDVKPLLVPPPATIPTAPVPALEPVPAATVPTVGEVPAPAPLKVDPSEQVPTFEPKLPSVPPAPSLPEQAPPKVEAPGSPGGVPVPGFTPMPARTETPLVSTIPPIPSAAVVPPAAQSVPAPAVVPPVQGSGQAGAVLTAPPTATPPPPPVVLQPASAVVPQPSPPVPQPSPAPVPPPGLPMSRQKQGANDPLTSTDKLLTKQAEAKVQQDMDRRVSEVGSAKITQPTPPSPPAAPKAAAPAPARPAQPPAAPQTQGAPAGVMPAGIGSVVASSPTDTPWRWLPFPVMTIPNPPHAPKPPPPEIPHAPDPIGFSNAFTEPQAANRKDNSMQRQQWQPPYGRMPGYGTMPGYGMPPGYGAMPGYGMPPGYGTPSYGMPPGYGTMPGYGASYAMAPYYPSTPGAMPSYPPMPYYAGMMPPSGQMAMAPPFQATVPRSYSGPLPPNPMPQPSLMAANYQQMAPMQPWPMQAYANPAMDRSGLRQPAPQSTPGLAALQQLLATLRSAVSPAQREWAATSLVAYDWRSHPQAVQGLLVAAKEDPAGSVQASCVQTLGRMGVQRELIANELAPLRQHTDPRVREAVEQVLR